jgi:hypothetical protein
MQKFSGKTSIKSKNKYASMLFQTAECGLFYVHLKKEDNGAITKKVGN